jgi:hypothetical protein
MRKPNEDDETKKNRHCHEVCQKRKLAYTSLDISTLQLPSAPAPVQQPCLVAPALTQIKQECQPTQTGKITVEVEGEPEAQKEALAPKPNRSQKRKDRALTTDQLRERNTKHARKSRAKKVEAFEQAQLDATEAKDTVTVMLNANGHVYNQLLAQFGEDWMEFASELGWKQRRQWLQEAEAPIEAA